MIALPYLPPKPAASLDKNFPATPVPASKPSTASANVSSPVCGIGLPYLSNRGGNSRVASEGAGEGDLDVLVGPASCR